MANRLTGGITPWSTNFEAEIGAPLDARLATPEYPQLADSSIPYPYPGMIVAVTNDENRSPGGDVANNGIYLFTAATSKPAADSHADWTKIATDGGATIASVSDVDGVQTITMTDGSGPYVTVFEQLDLFEFNSNGGYYSVNANLDYEGGSSYNQGPTLYVQRGTKYKIVNNASAGAHPLFISKQQAHDSGYTVQADPVGLDGNTCLLYTSPSPRD